MFRFMRIITGVNMINVGDRVSTFVDINKQEDYVTGNVEKISPIYHLLHIKLDDPLMNYYGATRLIRQEHEVKVLGPWIS